MIDTLKYALLFAGLFLLNSAVAQKRFKSAVFTTIDSSIDVQYGEAINIKAENEKLLLDIFTPPREDTMKRRPLIIFIHGGGFQNNSKVGGYSSRLCATFAKRGYVSASIDYRLGVEKTGMDSGKKIRSNKDYAEALYRAQQDGKAAVRFFRRYANQYGIDTSQIFITGSSAGAKTCMAMAYLDEDELPKDIDINKWGNLEGNSGNAGYSSKVNAVINAWGAMIDYKCIKKGDVPLFNTAGTNDKTVPYDSSFDYHGFKYGPYILYQHCLKLGIPTGWRPFSGAGHTLDNNKIKQDSCIQSIADWLYTQLKINSSKNEEGVFRYRKEMTVFDSLNQAEKYPSNSIMFLGSSYIRLWKNIREDVHYKNIIHRGFGGCNLRDVAFYAERIIYPHQPKAIFIYVGNDIVAGEKDRSPDQVLELYKYIVKVIRVKYPKIPVTWLAISPSEKRWTAWEEIQLANQLIKDYCAITPNLYYIESASKFLGKEGKPIASLYRDDKLHYNETGYKVWGKNIAQKVKKISKK